MINLPPKILLAPEREIIQFICHNFDGEKGDEFIVCFENEVVVYDNDFVALKKIPINPNYRKLQFIGNTMGYINQFDELVIVNKGEVSVVEDAINFRFDTHKNQTRILVEGKNNIKLLLNN